jgi:(p)ppGpp synthase/HD superfamily hydrolase
VNGLLLKRALDHAAVLHRGQKRKYPGVDVPYVSHLAGVVAILARHGFGEHVLAAGALHDAMEDQGVTFAELEARFGREVAELVRHVSEEDKSLPWEERKQAYAEKFLDKPWEAQAITMADKIDNIRSIHVCRADHGDPWGQFRRGRDAQLARFADLVERARKLPPHPLIDELAEAVASLDGV